MALSPRIVDSKLLLRLFIEIENNILIWEKKYLRIEDIKR